MTGSAPGVLSPAWSRHAATAELRVVEHARGGQAEVLAGIETEQIDRRIDAAGVSESGDHAEPGAVHVPQHMYVTGRLDVRHQRQPVRLLRQHGTRQGLRGFGGLLRGVPAKAV